TPVDDGKPVPPGDLVALRDNSVLTVDRSPKSEANCLDRVLGDQLAASVGNLRKDTFGPPIGLNVKSAKARELRLSPVTNPELQLRAADFDPKKHRNGSFLLSRQINSKPGSSV